MKQVGTFISILFWGYLASPLGFIVSAIPYVFIGYLFKNRTSVGGMTRTDSLLMLFWISNAFFIAHTAVIYLYAKALALKKILNPLNFLLGVILIAATMVLSAHENTLLAGFFMAIAGVPIAVSAYGAYTLSKRKKESG